MKFYVFCFISLSLFSCSNGYEEDLNNIEYLLGTDLNVEYEITNVETPFDFADYYLSFDLKFSKKDFNSLLEDISIDKFEEIDRDTLGLQFKFQYYREHISEEQKIFLTIGTINNSLHYSSIR